MTVASGINENRGDTFYNSFYGKGGWKYSTWREFWWHRRNIVKRFKLRRGMKMLEVACGNGFHTNLFRRMGFDCVGVDRAQGGIDWASEHFPKSKYVCCDMREMPFEENSFDVVVARGCSHYHYDLASETALDSTQLLSRYLRPGGVFIMTIITDLSGRNEQNKVWQNTLNAYQKHFASFGKKWSADWEAGMVICGLYNAPEISAPTRESDAPGMVLAT